jgi:polyisoprenoid-binding protein YceI
MLRPLFAILLVASLGSAAFAADVSKDPAKAPSGTYKLETQHSLVLFSVLHTGLTDYYGRFDKLQGSLSFDGNTPEKSGTTITIDTTSVDTPSARLNDILRDTSVFSSTQFPTATFKSSSITRTGPDTGHIEGILTMKGVTKPVVLDVVFRGGGSNPVNGNYALGFHATTTIKRSDFGMTGAIWSPFVSDDVTLTIEAMFEQEKN